MALQIPEARGPMVVAPYKDPHGFDQGYQQQLRERVIGAHLGHILGPIAAIDTVPLAQPQRIPDRRTAINHETGKPGPLRTHVATNLITCDQLKFRPDRKAKFEEN